MARAILADSGNGAHLLYRVDLANDEAATALVRDMLAALASRFDRPAVNVDRAFSTRRESGNYMAPWPAKGIACPTGPTGRPGLWKFPSASRLCPPRCYRPWRQRQRSPPRRPSTNGNGFTSRLDVGRWLTDRGVGYRVKERPDNHGRTVYLFAACPFNESHGPGGDTAIYQARGRQAYAACKHNSCNGRGWHEFKDAIGPPDPAHWDPPLRRHQDAKATKPSAAADKPTDPPAFTKLLTGADLLALDLRPRFLVRGVLMEGQPMIIGGRSKTLKTSVASDLALSLGSGSPFLGKFDAHRVNVGFWSGESGAATLRETAKRQAESQGR